MNSHPNSRHPQGADSVATIAMRHMRNHPWISLLAALALVFLFEYASNPLRWPDGWLQAWLYHKVPVGSTETHFLVVAKKAGWRINGAPWKGSRIDLNSWGSFYPSQPSTLEGSTFYFVHLGTFHMIFREDVQAFWSFDEQGRLLAVRYRREIDSF